jgi:GNAT superfamily N-acetyltransferase
MALTVADLDPADTTAVDDAFEVVTASYAELDIPNCRHRFDRSILQPWPEHRSHHLLAHRDGAPAGYLELSLPQRRNLGTALVEVHVHPDHRRRGVGRVLLDRAVRAARAQGRQRLVAQSAVPLGAVSGPTFAAAVGATAALTNTRSRLDLAAVEPAVLDRLAGSARVHADGYTLVHWRDAAPDEYLADVAYLDSRLLADAPTGDLALEPDSADPARIRQVEAALRAGRRATYHTGVRHDATGRLVGWTMIDFGATTGWHAFQQITLVDPEHRGHRLGMLIKVANLRHARADRPDWRVLDTFNAASNRHMLAINTALGFRPVEHWIDWQLEL